MPQQPPTSSTRPPRRSTSPATAESSKDVERGLPLLQPGRCRDRSCALLRATLAEHEADPQLRVQAGVGHRDEVIVTYEATRTDGTRFRNTPRCSRSMARRSCRAEVYFGWDLD